MNGCVLFRPRVSGGRGMDLASASSSGARPRDRKFCSRVSPKTGSSRQEVRGLARVRSIPPNNRAVPAELQKPSPANLPPHTFTPSPPAPPPHLHLCSIFPLSLEWSNLRFGGVSVASSVSRLLHLRVTVTPYNLLQRPAFPVSEPTFVSYINMNSPEVFLWVRIYILHLHTHTHIYTHVCVWCLHCDDTVTTVTVYLLSSL